MLKPNQTASQRTKNRFKEHHLVLSPDVVRTDIMGHEGRQMIHARCTDDNCPAFGMPWIGWLPLDEMESVND